MFNQPTVPEIVAVIRRSAMYWAPEIKAAKLRDYLDAYGEPLRVALATLPREEQIECGLVRA